MKLVDVKKIENDKERAIQAALCSEIPANIRPWFALLAFIIGAYPHGNVKEGK